MSDHPPPARHIFAPCFEKRRDSDCWSIIYFRYDEVGGAKDSLEKLREVVELPLLHPERFLTLGIDPPKGVLLYGPRKCSPPTNRPSKLKFIEDAVKLVFFSWLL